MKYISITYYECLKLIRQPVECITPLLFFIFVTVLFPMTLTPQPELAPSIIWIAIILATLLNMPRLLQGDFDEGVLEQVLISHVSLPLVMLCKILAHWLLSALPMILISPLLAGAFHLSYTATGVLIMSLLLGTPVLTLIAAVLASLTVGCRNGTFLLSLLVLPLYVPVLIFGSGSVLAAIAGVSAVGPLLLLLSMLLLAASLVPLASAAAIRIGLS